MLDPGALADLGGWATAVAVSLIVLEGFRRGWVVPGHVYRREVKRGDRLEQANQRLVQRIAAAEASARRDA